MVSDHRCIMKWRMRHEFSFLGGYKIGGRSVHGLAPCNKELKRVEIICSEK